VQTKLSKEFTTAVAAFQRVQRLSAEKQRSHVETQKRRVEELADEERCARCSSGSFSELTGQPWRAER
jgi:syntaxin 7